MADATQFFRAAASQIRSGITAWSMEIGELRHDIDIKLATSKKQAQDVQQIILATEAALAITGQQDQNSDKTRSDKLRQINQLRGEISEMDRNVQREREQMNAKIKAIEQSTSELEQMAKKLESIQ